jgi:hypothetical protein
VSGTQGALVPHPDGIGMPRWLQREHCYDLDQDLERLVLFLQRPCQATRVPFMAPDLPEGYVERPQILRPLKDAVLTNSRVGLWGPPGSVRGLTPQIWTCNGSWPVLVMTVEEPK